MSWKQPIAPLIVPEGLLIGSTVSSAQIRLASGRSMINSRSRIGLPDRSTSATGDSELGLRPLIRQEQPVCSASALTIFVIWSPTPKFDRLSVASHQRPIGVAHINGEREKLEDR